MWKKLLEAGLVVLSLAGVGLLAPGLSSKVEACISCVNGQCEPGGDGYVCRETHWANGSSVCDYIDGCVY